MNKIFDTHVENKNKGQLSPKRVLKKPRWNFSGLSLPFCKPNNKLVLNMADMVKNVKANCDLVYESIDTSLQTK